jgi:hypothetical protein
VESIDVYCRKCGRKIGAAMDDSQYLRLGDNANIWLAIRIQCRCGFWLIWKPKDPPNEQTESQLAIEKEWRNALGRKPRVADKLEG